MKTEKSTRQVTVEMKPIDIQTFKLRLRGIQPLLMSRFTEEAQKKMLDSQTGKTREKKVPRDIKTEVEEAIHKTSDGTPAFPASGFKKAMVEVAPYLSGLDKKLAKGAFFILGTNIPIKFTKQTVNQAVARMRGTVPIVRFRPEFHNWSCELPIRYNAGQITPNQICNLAKLAGFHIGVGSWRPQCGGTYGMFEVETGKAA